MKINLAGSITINEVMTNPEQTYSRMMRELAELMVTLAKNPKAAGKKSSGQKTQPVRALQVLAPCDPMMVPGFREVVSRQLRLPLDVNGFIITDVEIQETEYNSTRSQAHMPKLRVIGLLLALKWPDGTPYA